MNEPYKVAVGEAASCSGQWRRMMQSGDFGQNAFHFMCAQ
jgi:hypothetical protein